jgi:hypothetical protein
LPADVNNVNTSAGGWFVRSAARFASATATATDQAQAVPCEEPDRKAAPARSCGGRVRVDLLRGSVRDRIQRIAEYGAVTMCSRSTAIS